jgi:hypothetical protein
MWCFPKSTTPCRSAQKLGRKSRLGYRGNLLLEIRNGFIVDAEVFQANGTAERDAALVIGSGWWHASGDGGAAEKASTRSDLWECRILRVFAPLCVKGAAMFEAAPHTGYVDS